MAERLKDIQSWIYGVITHPENIDQGAKNMSDIDGAWDIESVVAPSKSLTSHERINIYRNSYFLRLLDCFKHEFSGLDNALGDEMFNHFVWAYLQAHPSTSYTLNELGSQFPNYLRTTLEASLNGGEPDWWQLFIIDLATYERAYVETFNGDGHEKLLSNEIFAEVPLKISPALRLLQLNFPVSECISAFRKNEFENIPDPHPTNYAITREDYHVRVHRLDKDAYIALKRWVNEPKSTCPDSYKMDWELKGICYA